MEIGLGCGMCFYDMDALGGPAGITASLPCVEYRRIRGASQLYLQITRKCHLALFQ